MMNRICSKCNINKPISCFSVNNPKHPKTFKRACNNCRAINNKKYERFKPRERKIPLLSEDERRARINKANQMWRIRNPEKWKASNRLNRHKRRSLTPIKSTEWIAKVAILGNKCQFCQKTEPEIKITIDHIIPISKGGTNHIDNLQPLCLFCNQRKHNNQFFSLLKQEVVIN